MKSRLAIFTPLPPSKSGIADYSLEIGRALSRYWDLNYIISDEADDVNIEVDWANIYRVSEWNQLETDNVPRFYQMGNNIHHEYIYREILKTPGITLMHDFSMHHLLVELTLARNDSESYIQLMQYSHGATGRRIAEYRVHDFIHHPMVEFMFPLNKQVITNSYGVLLHSNDSLTKLKQAYPEIPAHRIPFPYEELEENYLTGSKENSRKKFNIDKSLLVFASFGFVTPPKQISLAIRAMAKIKDQIPDFRYYLVGEVSDAVKLPELLKETGLEKHVVTTGFVSFEEFHQYLEATDVVISLRYPSAGETSAALMRAMGMSRANIVFDYASFADYPDDAVIKVPINTYDVDTLAETLKYTANDEAYRNAVGLRAGRYVKERHNIDRVVGDISTFINNHYIETTNK